MTEPSGARTIRRALISAWRKKEAVELAKYLDSVGVRVVASGGTATAISEVGITVERVSVATGFDNLLGGRVKTLHPAVHAGILARRDDARDLADLKAGGIEPFDLVAVDLYPFPEPDLEISQDEAIELIDIGGVALIRGAAKNFEYVVVLSNASQFVEFGVEMVKAGGKVSRERRRQLAAEAFQYTAGYDGRIASRLSEADQALLPDSLALTLTRGLELRYGENPHQTGAFYYPADHSPAGIAAITQYGGKPLSFTNLLDLDIALRLPLEFAQPAAAILKHTTPCGIGVGSNPFEALGNARSTDPQSAFGGIIGFNREVDLVTAEAVREWFVEVVAAPAYHKDALAVLKKSKNLRIIEYSGSVPAGERDFRSILGGMLVQEHDQGFPEFGELRAATQRQPDGAQLEALKFAWIAVRYVKSNAIVIADGSRTIGIGAGQMSRVDAAHLAVWKARQAGLDTVGAVAASDAFFPFRDGLDVLVDAGVNAVIQPGGSVKDPEVIAAADERGVAMVFAGRRHFRH